MMSEYRETEFVASNVYASKIGTPHPAALQDVQLGDGEATSLSPELPETVKATSVRGADV